MGSHSPGPRPVVVFDLDGTLADVRHRLHRLAGPRKDWDGFHRDSVRDPLLPEGAALAAELAADHGLVYVTGRPEKWRRITAEWLRRQGLPEGRLVMRRAGDRRPARIAKTEMVRALIRSGTDVVLAVDDDPLVVAEYRRTGIKVREATWMPRSEDLDTAQESDGRA